MEAFLKTGKVGSGPAGAAGGKKKERKAGPVPWVEKYRPRTITDVAHQVTSTTSSTYSSEESPPYCPIMFRGPRQANRVQIEGNFCSK